MGKLEVVQGLVTPPDAGKVIIAAPPARAGERDLIGRTARGRELYAIAGGAVSAFWYGQSIMQAFGSGSSGGAPNIDFLSDTIKCMLCTSTYTPDQDTHVFKSDITNEVVGTGYTATGVTLAGKTLGYTAGTNVTKWFSSDPSWTGATFTARYAVYYNATPGTDATRPLLWYVDFGASFTVTASVFTITVDSAGLATVTVS